MSLFLTPAEMRELTGFALKSKQIEQLRRMGIAFLVNGCGRPVVTVAAIEGTKKPEVRRDVWQPAVLMNTGHGSHSASGDVQHAKGKTGKTKRAA